MSVSWRRDEQNVCPYNVMLFSYRREWSTYTGYSMGESSKHVKWKKQVTEGHILCEMCRVSKSIETQGRLIYCQKFWVRKRWEMAAHGQGFYGGDENVLN